MFKKFSKTKKDKEFYKTMKKFLQKTGEEDLLEDEQFMFYMMIISRAKEEPVEMMEVCMSVILSICHFSGLPVEMFDELLEMMSEKYHEEVKEIPLVSPELRRSMDKFNLV